MASVRGVGRFARAIALAVVTAAGCGGDGPVAILHTAGGPVTVALELATTPAARTRGLMYRTALADGHGMLFVFPATDVHDFWMKNTLISLDMLFIGDDQRIAGIRADAPPLSTAPIGIGRPSRWVLEVAAGFAARRAIAAGDRVELRGVPPAAS